MMPDFDGEMDLVIMEGADGEWSTFEVPDLDGEFDVMAFGNDGEMFNIAGDGLDFGMDGEMFDGIELPDIDGEGMFDGMDLPDMDGEGLFDGMDLPDMDGELGEDMLGDL